MRKDNRAIHDVWPEFETYARRYGSLFSNVAGVAEIGEVDDSNEKSAETWGESRYRDVADDDDTDADSGAQRSPKSDRGMARSSEERSASSSRQMPVTPPHGAPLFPDPHRTPAQAAGLRATSQLRNRSPGATSAVDEKQEAAHGTALGMGAGGNRRVSRAPTVIPRNQAITQDDIRESGERIFARYLVTGAEKEIYLP